MDPGASSRPRCPPRTPRSPTPGPLPASSPQYQPTVSAMHPCPPLPYPALPCPSFHPFPSCPFPSFAFWIFWAGAHPPRPTFPRPFPAPGKRSWRQGGRLGVGGWRCSRCCCSRGGGGAPAGASCGTAAACGASACRTTGLRYIICS